MMMKPRCGRKMTVLLAFIAVFAMTAVFVSADVLYMPDVTEEMTKAGYWSSKADDPDAVLATYEEIQEINAAICADSSTNVTDLANYGQETYNGVSLNQSLKASAEDDAQYFFNVWSRYDADGNYYGTWDAAKENIYGPMIENCVDPDATEQMPVKYAVCTTRTTLHAFPSDAPLMDDPSDPDFDNQYLAAVRVNEPLILKNKSADGKYYVAVSNCASGWVPVSDVAICKDKEEWLAAWHFDPDRTLVVYDDKIRTEDSNSTPETANLLLPMGTCLELADEADWTPLISNRSAHNNHVVWMPVRSEDGTYKKQLALIAEHAKVSEGYLPLTAANIEKVALNYLGDTYGWGGMLTSEDCSGYVRDVYKCFGLDLARNTTWQEKQPVKKYKLTGLSDDEKTAIIRNLPVGAVLIFNGHEMIYLGCEGDKLYVISSISKIATAPGKTQRIRGSIINTLDTLRSSGNTWLKDMSTAEIPYYLPEADDPAPYSVAYSCIYGDGAVWMRGSTASVLFTFERSKQKDTTFSHFTGVRIDGEDLDASQYSAVEGSVKISLPAEYLDTLPAGEHVLTAVFDDGLATAAFTVEEQAPQMVTLKFKTKGSGALDDILVLDANGRAVTLTENEDGTYSFTMPDGDISVESTIFGDTPSRDDSDDPGDQDEGGASGDPGDSSDSGDQDGTGDESGTVSPENTTPENDEGASAGQDDGSGKSEPAESQAKTGDPANITHAIAAMGGAALILLLFAIRASARKRKAGQSDSES